MIMSSNDLTGCLDRARVRPAGRLGSARWLSGAVAVSAAALIAVTGCASGAKAPAGGTTGATNAGGGTHPGSGGTGGGKSLTAQKAIRLAASASARVNSLTASLSVQTGGVGLVGGLSGGMKIQVKPTLIEANFNVVSAVGSHTQIEEILTSNAIYFKDAALARVSGKPWIKISFSQLSSRIGLSFSSLVRSLQSTNPLAQTKLFTISKDIRVVGTQVVAGVPTTEYAGSYQPDAALAALSPQFRKTLGPLLRSMGASSVQFNVWIDGQHLIRKAVSHEAIGGHSVTSTYVVTSINQPITVTLPSASEIGTVPGL